MKKMTMVLAVAIIVSIAGSAMAFNLPTTSGSLEREVKKEATKQATTAGANSALKKYRCDWDAKSRVATGKKCDLTAISAILIGQNEFCGRSGAYCTLSINTTNSSLFNDIKRRLNTGGSKWNVTYGAVGSATSASFRAQ